MDKYYSLTWKEEKGASASAFTPKGIRLTQDLISDLNEVNKLPFELSLVKLDIDKKGLIKSDDLDGVKIIWKDFLYNDLTCSLVSEKMKSVIEDNLMGNEGVDWIEAIINAPNEQRVYYILRFNKIFDILDLEKTRLIPGTDSILKPVFSLPKISMYNAFTISSANDNYWKIPSGFYVSENLKKSLQKEKLTGLNFEVITVE